MRCAAASDSGTIVDVVTHRIDHYSNAADPGAVWGRLVDLIAEFAGEAHDGLNPDDPIAIAFPGPISDHSTIVGAPTVVGPAADMPDLATIICERTGRPVYLLNDVSAAVWHFLDVVPTDRFMVVTVSSGIGSKLVDRSRPTPVLDDWPYAGEIGHITVDARVDAPVCDCGGRGHLGAISSGRGTENLARRRSRLDPVGFETSSCAIRFGATRDRLTNEEHLVPAAIAGDPWAWSVIREAQEPLAQVLAIAIVAASLSRVTIIGGFATILGSRYIDSLRDAVQGKFRPGLLDIPIADVIDFGPFGSEACLRGAGLFAAAMVRATR